MNDRPATGSAGTQQPELSCDDLAAQLFARQTLRGISWQDLPESEKAQWREQAEQSLAAVAELGFQTYRSPDSSRRGEAERLCTEETNAAIRDAEQLLHMGEPLLAYNAIQQALLLTPTNVRLRQLKGLALARSGALLRANQELSLLRDEGLTDGETLGLLARTHKDLALVAKDDASRGQHLEEAFNLYLDGYRESVKSGSIADGYYTGINAATMALLRGDNAGACRLSTEVEALCEQALRDAPGDSADAYWARATLAEAALIRGDRRAAQERYATAASLVADRYGDLSSTRHQARLLLDHLDEPADWLDEAMCVPPVLVYTGHMIDAPARASPRFTPEMESSVREEIRQRVERLRPVAAYGSAACGADILCLECVRDLGGELHIVLPFPVEHFINESVDTGPAGQWLERFERLLEDAKEVLVTGERPSPDCTSAFEYANLIMTGLASLRAQMLDTRLCGLAVWDGTDSGDAGGTSSVVDMWQSQGIPLEHVRLATDSAAVRSTMSPQPPGYEDAGFRYNIKAMLFADAVGYSRLSEQQIPLFFQHYIGAIARFTGDTPYKAVHVETAGDGMYMVFADPYTAGHYALDLIEVINQQDWPGCGLPADLGARIGLHCGPVFAGSDPITGKPLFSGIHTSRTARIEPITPPGQVYASSAFAAVAMAQGSAGLRFSYIGRTRLAKGYGVFPLYHVKREAYEPPLRLTPSKAQ